MSDSPVHDIRRRGRTRWTVAVLLAAAALPMAGCGSGGKADDADGTRGGDTTSQRPADDSTWAEGITPEWMSEQMGLDIPPTARSAEAAYEITSQFDTGLLTFTLTRSEAEKYLAENPPQGKWLEPTAAAGPTPHDFAHLGLPEPESFKEGMRYGDVCPGYTPTEDDPNSDDHCFELYVHDYAPDRTRIYLREHYEPGISPLPTPSSSEK
ncbi:hypothetical protein ACIG0D_17625 [Streptomyces sp. NPDC052773]|uniref:hypothetical protein n=1 Tax=Streptomyces sp. NPDC052773 TaxID=3365693 RepID=UPI0037D8B99F